MSVGFDLISKVKLTDWFAENTRCGMMHPARHREMTKLNLSGFSWSLSASSSEFFTWKLSLKDKKHETYIVLVQRRQFGWVSDCMWSRCIVVSLNHHELCFSEAVDSLLNVITFPLPSLYRDLYRVENCRTERFDSPFSPAFCRKNYRLNSRRNLPLVLLSWLSCFAQKRVSFNQ